MKESVIEIKRALISVTDKTHLEKLVTHLHSHGVELISTGGTKKFIEDLKIPVTPIERVTGNPEAFGGRMKSISFQVSSGLLFRRYHDHDLKESSELKIVPIDMVVCNLYPFKNYRGQNSPEDILIENIDIGGPLMLRAGAKNYEGVTVLSDVLDYEYFITHYKNQVDFKYRRDQAVKTFKRIAEYDLMIADELQERFPINEHAMDVFDRSWISLSPLKNVDSSHAEVKSEGLRYGENPHQWAKIFHFDNTRGPVALSRAKVLQGKELSYNNWVDADAAWRIVSDVAHLSSKTKSDLLHGVAVIKHANPCGLALAKSQAEALNEAWNGDKISSFGGIISFSTEVTLESARFLAERFIEVVIAPGFAPEAIEVFSKKKNVRLLLSPLRPIDESEIIVKSISGGLLVQNEDEFNGKLEELKCVTKKSFQDEDQALAQFGILACKHLKSNGIALVYKSPTEALVLAGTGMGQPNRLDSLRLLAKNRALEKGLSMDELLLVSDAFFPFADSIEACYQVGIKSVIQPGGSMRDDEVIAACDRLGVSMLFSGKRHFRH